MRNNSILTALRYGLAGRCPVCGVGRLFGKFLKPCVACPSCGADNSIYPSDDLPPYLTILVVGHVVVPLFMWVDHTYAPPIWFQSALFLPLTVLLSLLLLQPLKGAAIGISYATGLRTPA